MPLVLTVAFNAINIGYFWFLVLQMTAVPRLGVEYATQGGAAMTSTGTSWPGGAAVSDLVYEDLQHTINATVLNASVQVCSVSTTSSSDATCTHYGPTVTFPDMTTDSEAPLWTRRRVIVVYTVTPLIPGTIFNVSLPSTLVFRRQVTMRSLYL
jgi:hypothetical protein